MAATIKVILKGKLEKKKQNKTRYALVSKSAVGGGGAVAEGRICGICAQG